VGDAGSIGVCQRAVGRDGTVSPFHALHGSIISTALLKTDKARKLLVADNSVAGSKLLIINYLSPVMVIMHSSAVGAKQ
jgi:hypothetical protein